MQRSAFCQRRARALALEFGLSLAGGGYRQKDFLLLVNVQRLGLASGLEVHSSQSLWPDLGSLDISTSAGARTRQPLYRAVLGRKKIQNSPLVLDLTAGLGRDAWLLAAGGARVVALERSSPIFALLRDSLARAGIDRPDIVQRIKPIHADAWQALGCLAQKRGKNIHSLLQALPDVIYLDPFFSDYKRKGAPKKEIQLLRSLADKDDQQWGMFLAAALGLARKRVVVKRPAHGPVLEFSGLAEPSLQIKSRALRFDVYLT